MSQTLEQRIAALGNGTVRLSFVAHAGVCAGGMHNTGVQQANDEWEPDCERRPVRVALRIRDGHPVAVRTYVGRRWRSASPAHDLGTIPPSEAASYLLKLTAQRRPLSGDPILPATLADSSVTCPSLLDLARNKHLPHDRRRSAILWLGQSDDPRALDLFEDILQ